MKFEFRQISIDETSHWNLDGSGLPEGVRIFSTSFYRVGEATYCASLTPSSWTEFLRNDFVYPDDLPMPDDEQDPARVFMSDNEYENGGETGAYIDYHWAHAMHGQSDLIVVELDPADYEDNDEGREQMRLDAWAEAQEQLTGNWRDSIPPAIALAA